MGYSEEGKCQVTFHCLESCVLWKPRVLDNDSHVYIRMCLFQVLLQWQAYPGLGSVT